MKIIKIRSLVAAFAITLAGEAIVNNGVCQEARADTCRNAIYAEILGPGLLYSINYDYRITTHFGLRAGVSRWSVPAIFVLVNGSIGFTGFPITANYLSGEGSSHLELGVGVVPVILTLNGEEVFFGSNVRDRKTLVMETMTMGYRYQPPDGGIVFRIAFTPLMVFDKVVPFGGISLGAAF